ncbi:MULTISPECIES: hypothetical protein [unclassified Microbacterium]|uniref:hypothetical protein n=1 Tax=unclassified Microbacterium TaxID=2609290 RepID=UPI0010F9C5D2|nr:MULTISPECIES: hypothetical protein [unclassified Microbacterium]
MSPLDIIPIPGHPGKHARRVIVEAWQAAGRPPINSALRLYDEQKYFYDGWVDRIPGFNPADNPDDETQQLAHVRGVALDIDPTPDRVRRLAAAGLIRPFSYEPWHWTVPNVRTYPIARIIPTTAGGLAPDTDTIQEEDMPNGYYAKGDKSAEVYWIDQTTGKRRKVPKGELTAAQAFNVATGGKFGAGHVAVMPQSDFDAIPKI